MENICATTFMIVIKKFYLGFPRCPVAPYSCVVKVFQLSDGKISARFWHIAARRQMWLQLKTVTPHANQPKQLPATSYRGRFHHRSLHPMAAKQRRVRSKRSAAGPAQALRRQTVDGRQQHGKLQRKNSLFQF